METTPPRVTVAPEPGQSLVDQARAAGAEHYHVDPENISVGEPIPLAPSVCVQIPARVRAQLEGGGTWYVQLPDGSIIEGDSDEALALVSRRCFIESGLIPDHDAAADLVLTVGRSELLAPLDDPKGRKRVEEIGREWSPPTATPTDDGFVITLFAQDPFTRAVYEVTSTIDGDSASTDFKKIG